MTRERKMSLTESTPIIAAAVLRTHRLQAQHFFRNSPNTGVDVSFWRSTGRQQNIVRGEGCVSFHVLLLSRKDEMWAHRKYMGTFPVKS